MAALEDRFRPFAPNLRFLDRQTNVQFFLPGTYQLERTRDAVFGVLLFDAGNRFDVDR